MFTALGLIGLSIWGKIDDKLKEKEKQQKELEQTILKTKDYEVTKKYLNTTSCYEFKTR